MSGRLRVIAAALLLAAAGPAPDQPPAEPSRDALIGYHVIPAAGEPIDVRLSVRAGRNTLRLDLPDQTYLIADPITESLVMVVPLQRATISLPWASGPHALFSVGDDGARYARKGEASIAGQRCTVWDEVKDGVHSASCVTKDGIVLRRQSPVPPGMPLGTPPGKAPGKANVIEAFAIRYQALPPEDYLVPLDFDRLGSAPQGPEP